MKNKDTNTLKSELQNFYQDKSLSDTRLKQLQNAGKNRQAYQRWGRRTFGALAASVLLTTTLYVFTLPKVDYIGLSEEIAYNHNSQMQMEVFSESILDIQQYLNRLDFSLIDSMQLPSLSWQLVGGRYCSIDGKIAAQLKIKNKHDQKIYTFYQAKLPEDTVNSIEMKEVKVDGVKVKLWKENGLLMGLAQ